MYKSEQIAEIRWTVTGKVSDVTRTGGSNKPDLHFDYDAMGQRIAKTVTNKNVTMGDKFVTTYYVRDPQGNVLAVYEHKHGDSDNGTFTLAEQHLYGAGRLGMRKRDLALNVANASETPATYYELTNHLGNVMAVISDKASDTNEPTVVSLSDYYPFGMTEPGRSWNAGDYRFGYTGHEKENDLAEGVYTTEYRLLDTRLGRWMSVDPLFAKYVDVSSYNYCLNNPVVYIDPTGAYIPNEDGNLVAEEGDNVESLAEFLSWSVDDAKKLMESQGYTDLKKGDIITLDNAVTRDLKSNRDRDVSDPQKADIDDYLIIEGYNCFGSTISGIRDGEIVPAEMELYPHEKTYRIPQLCDNDKEGEYPKSSYMSCAIVFDECLSQYFQPIQPEDAVFMKTAIRIALPESSDWVPLCGSRYGNISGGAQHGCIYYGKSQDGTIYVYTKNGFSNPPRIMKLNELLETEKDYYGNIMGIGNDSGYYIHKEEE